REQERLAEIAAGQARTARFQRLTRWAFAAVGAVILFAGGIVGWLQWDKSRQLETKEAALIESRHQLETKEVELTENRQQLNRRQVELDHAQSSILGELSGTKLTRRELD